MVTLEGKTALITGGGSGLGRAICSELAQAGMTIAVADIREEAAEQTVEAIECAGGKAFPLWLDVADPEAGRAALDRVERSCGGLDVLVNNAGVDVTLSIDDVSFAEWERVMRTNLFGPFVLSKLAFPALRRRGGGSIINVASTAAKRAWANASAYHASKWGVLGLSHALHVEGRTSGIRVTAVICGGMRTPFLLERFPGIDLNVLQEPGNVARTVHFVLTLPEESVIPEITVLPLRETSWP